MYFLIPLYSTEKPFRMLVCLLFSIHWSNSYHRSNSIFPGKPPLSPLNETLDCPALLR